MFLLKEDLFHIPRSPVYSHFLLWYCCCCHTSQFKGMSTSNVFSCTFHCVLSGFLWTAWFNRLEASWWQCCQQHNCHLLHVCFSPSQKRSMCSSSLFVIYLRTEVHKRCCVFTLKQAMKEICLAMQQEIKGSLERTSFGSFVPDSKKNPSPGCCSSNAVNPVIPEDWRIFISELLPIFK